MAKKSAGKKKSAKGRKSAKGKRKKRSAKSAKPEGPPPPRWPWAHLTEKWLPPSPYAFDQLQKKMRSHYLQTEGVVCSQDEWRRSVALHKHPYPSQAQETMVQMLTCLLAEEGSRKDPPDDFVMLAAALRCRHSEEHYGRMYQALKHWFDQVDNPTLFDRIMAFFNPERLTEEYTHFPREEARRLVEEDLSITYGLHLLVSPQAPEEQDADFHLFEPLADYLVSKRIRLTDFFFQLDKNNDGSLSMEEVLNGLASCDIQMGDEAIQALIKDLDSNGDGVVKYKELNSSRLSATMQRRQVKRALSARSQVSEETMQVVGKVLRMTYDDFVLLVLYAHYSTRP